MIIIELLDHTKTCGSQATRTATRTSTRTAQIVLKSEPVQIVIAKSEKI